ncbi:MAG TPA: aryl-sulfate sulfotransferase [Planctomycetota bacterium]|nr:aryl-sulfate sulfotransferase [Planctomycetota bacterium]
MARPLRAISFSLLLVASLAACGDPAPETTSAKQPAPGDGAKPDAAPEPEPPFAHVDGERGLRVNDAGALDGYTLIAPLCSKSIHLVGMDGQVAHTWKTNHVPAGATYFLPDGHLLRTAMVENNPRFHGGGIGGRIEELDWDGKLLWEYELATDQRTLHHDIARLPNGNVLAIGWEYHSPEEIFAHGRAANRVHEEGLWCDFVIEIEPTRPSGGKIVWTWRSFDHLVQDEREKAEGFGKIADFPGRIDVNADHRYDAPESEAERKAREEREKAMQGLGYGGGKDAAQGGALAHDAPGTNDKKKKEKYDADWLHMNAVDYLPEQDLIVVSVPHLCELWVIDHSTTAQEAAGSSGGKRGHGGELLYRYGHARNYGVDDGVGRKLRYQHNPTWQKNSAPGTLGLLVFDNGTERKPTEYSEVVELEIPFDAALGFSRKTGEAFGPSGAKWTYNDPGKLFSPFISGAQRLANGNTLICEGARGRVLEVTSAGKIVWDYYNPLGGEIKPAEQAGKAPAKSLFRATRIAKDHPGLAGKTLVAGGKDKTKSLGY